MLRSIDRSREPLNITSEIVWTCEACASPLIDGRAHTCGPNDGSRDQ